MSWESFGKTGLVADVSDTLTPDPRPARSFNPVTHSETSTSTPSRSPDVVVVHRRPQATARTVSFKRGLRGALAQIRRYDLTLFGAALALSLIGAVLVWSATAGRLVGQDLSPNLFFNKQLLNIVIAIALGVAVTRLDYRILRAYTPIVYGAVVFLLLVVLSPLGTEISGARAWLTLPAGFTLQPGELAKVVVILAMAMVLSERDVGFGSPRDSDVRLALIWAAGPIAIIILQSDLGTALVIAAIAVAVLAAANVRARWIAGLLGGGAALSAVSLAIGVLSQYQVDRLLTFLHPDADIQGVGYNVYQARVAIGGGGLFGQGLFNGPQTQGAFVPYQQTDFVFSVAAEELGLVGSALIIGLLALVIWRGVQIARNAHDGFGRLVAMGVVCWFAFQGFENIGMNLGIMPVTGVPLPFVSYGGTSMFAAWIGIGLLQCVHLRSRQ